MFLKRVQIGLLHLAAAITLVPINSTLNRIMIYDLAISATVVALLVSLPYLFSPIQVAIGAFSDNRPLFGYRRTPYIVAGLILCVIGVMASPYLAFSIQEHNWLGILLSILVFGAWGMGFNFATVAYFALATEISGEKGRSATIATMFTMMILGIIATSIFLSRMLDPYSVEALHRAFNLVGGFALALTFLGVFGLEERSIAAPKNTENYSWQEMFGAIVENPQAARFFVYLVLLLTAILGQDILLEPYAAQAFNMPISQTTRITSIWGGSFLLAMMFAGIIERRIGKLQVSRLSAYGAISSFALIILSGFLGGSALFYVGVVFLGFATGFSTVSNLSLMLDMTTAERVGLFVGAWGMASALARLAGNMMSGLLRDGVNLLSTTPELAYQAVFLVQILMLVGSLVILSQVDVNIFLKRARSATESYVERASLIGDV